MKNDIVRDWLNSRLTVPIVSHLNRKMKRLVTIASLFGYLFNRNEHNSELEERLTKIMNLSENSNAITFPLVYHSVIWESVEKQHSQELHHVKLSVTKKIHKEKLSYEDLESCANLLISIIPSYLIYDTGNVIKQDFVHMLESLPFIFDKQYQLQ